jgi:hypothetical protein
LACGKPWPCDPAREAMMTMLDAVQVAIEAWDYLEQAAGDLRLGMTLAEMYERFIAWTRPARAEVAPPITVVTALDGHEHRRPETPEDWPAGVRTPDQFMFDVFAQIDRDPPEEHTGCVFCAQVVPHGWNSGPC